MSHIGTPRKSNVVNCHDVGFHQHKIRPNMAVLHWEEIVDRRCAALVVTLATVMACVATAAAAGQDREAFLAGQTINCPGCDLNGASLDRRDLTVADLSGADLRRTTFSRTI